MEEEVVAGEGGDHLTAALLFECAITNDQDADDKTVAVPKRALTPDEASVAMPDLFRATRDEACRQISELHKIDEKVDWVRFDKIVEDAVEQFTETRKRTGERQTMQQVQLDLSYEMTEEAPPPEEMEWPHLGYWLSCSIVRSSVTTTRWRNN